jgi:hypothetical protein
MMGIFGLPKRSNAVAMFDRGPTISKSGFCPRSAQRRTMRSHKKGEVWTGGEYTDPVTALQSYDREFMDYLMPQEVESGACTSTMRGMNSGSGRTTAPSSEGRGAGLKKRRGEARDPCCRDHARLAWSAIRAITFAHFAR